MQDEGDVVAGGGASGCVVGGKGRERVVEPAEAEEADGGGGGAGAGGWTARGVALAGLSSPPPAGILVLERDHRENRQAQAGGHLNGSITDRPIHHHHGGGRQVEELELKLLLLQPHVQWRIRGLCGYREERDG